MIEWSVNTSALDQEIDHYVALRNLDGPRLTTINYLYARLGIIDSKASSILSVNTLALGITSLVVTTASTPLPGGARQSPVGGPLLILSLAMVLCSLTAIILSLTITQLRFDHISPGHNTIEYEREFFRRTIGRQRILALARCFTGIAFLLYALLLGSVLLGFHG